MNDEQKRLTQPLFDAVDRLNQLMAKLADDGVSCDVEVMSLETLGDPTSRKMIIVKNVSQSWFFDQPQEVDHAR